MKPISWHIGRAIGKALGSKGEKAARKPNEVVWRAVDQTPDIEGYVDLGVVCGFDLRDCPFYFGGNDKVPLIVGNNLAHAKADCLALSAMVDEARGHERLIPKRMDIWFDDATYGTAEVREKTKTGRDSKYPLTIHISASPSMFEPSNFDDYIDACARYSDPEDIPGKKHDSFVAHLKYRKDGSLGSADVYMWTDDGGFHVSAIGDGGLLSLAMIERKLPDDRDFVVTYSTNPGGIGGVTKSDRQSKLSDLGIDVSQFTMSKVADDASCVLATYIPVIGVDMLNAKISIDFSNPTKNGRAPKNVALARFEASPDNTAPLSGTAVVSIKYLKDGSMNMADVEFSRKGLTLGIAVRKSGCDYSVTWVYMGTGIERTDLFSSYTEGVTASEAIEKALRSMK